MKKESIRVGIAGYGVVGKRRRQFIDQQPLLKTVAVCDQCYPKPTTMLDGVKCFPTYQRLLEEPLDVIFVSLPSYLAAEVTIAGLQKGLHVFCEKPPGRDVLDIQRTIEVEKQHPGRLVTIPFPIRDFQQEFPPFDDTYYGTRTASDGDNGHIRGSSLPVIAGRRCGLA